MAETSGRIRSRPATSPSAIETKMDELSLEQALIDFEVANARVVDLTQRLVSATNELVGARRELDATGAEFAAARDQLEALRRQHEALQVAYEGLARSRSVRLAAAARSLVNAIRR